MALSTAQDLVDSALRLLGVIDQEGTPTTAQRNQGLDALNAMIDSLAVDNLANYVYNDEAITLAAAATTWGTSGPGTINTTRPIRLLAARRVEGSYEYPIRILSMQEYRDRVDKGVTGTISAVAYNPGMSDGTLYAINGVGDVKITSVKPWTQYAALNTALALPPGYVRSLRHALAVELSPEYIVEPPQVSLGIADKMRTDLGRVNAQVQKIINPFCAGAHYEITSDEML